MIFQTYERLNNRLHDNKFLNDSGTGLYYFEYIYDEEIDRFFTEELDFPLREVLKRNKYFVLDNMYHNNIFIQKITFMEDDTSYIRTGAHMFANVGNVPFKYNINDHKLSDWTIEYVKEDDTGVMEVLQSTSKEYMHENYVPKEDRLFKNFFMYKGRINIDGLTNNNLSTGTYSVIDDYSNFNKIITVHSKFLNRRATVPNKTDMTEEIKKRIYKFPNGVYNKNAFEAVLENYNTDNYVYQTLYVSHPIISILNRIYVKRDNNWSSWRINQNEDDLYWLHNARPDNMYADLELHARKLKLNEFALYTNWYGLNNTNLLNNHLSNYRRDKRLSYESKANPIYHVHPNNSHDFSFGYLWSNNNTRTLIENYEGDEDILRKEAFNNFFPGLDNVISNFKSSFSSKMFNTQTWAITDHGDDTAVIKDKDNLVIAPQLSLSGNGYYASKSYYYSRDNRVGNYTDPMTRAWRPELIKYINGIMLFQNTHGFFFATVQERINDVNTIWRTDYNGLTSWYDPENQYEVKLKDIVRDVTVSLVRRES